MKVYPTQERLKALLDYDPDTGVFRWKDEHPGTGRGGSIAGCLDAEGYRIINIGHENFRAGRLAWLYVYGVVPNKVVDHINRCRADDRIENLRLATTRQNSGNKRHKSNKSGEKGVLYIKHCHHRPWRAFGKAFGKTVHIGAFASFYEAVKARRDWAAGVYGEFAN